VEEITTWDLVSIKGGLSYKGEFVGIGDAILVGMGAVSNSERFLFSGFRVYGGEFSETIGFCQAISLSLLGNNLIICPFGFSCNYSLFS
jgi:hypothetical protein